MGISAQWRSVVLRGEPKQVKFGFGHDFRDRELWIVDAGSGRRIALIASELSPSESEIVGRMVRQTPVLAEACKDAVQRLSKAKHPNAVKLREMILGALAGMELPCSDESSDRIDP
jgi:hypothetical protein